MKAKLDIRKIQTITITIRGAKRFWFFFQVCKWVIGATAFVTGLDVKVNVEAKSLPQEIDS